MKDAAAEEEERKELMNILFPQPITDTEFVARFTRYVKLGVLVIDSSEMVHVDYLKVFALLGTEGGTH